jgi:SH3-like domain-containing protein
VAASTFGRRGDLELSAFQHSSRPRTLIRTIALLSFLSASLAYAPAQAQQVGSVTGLPLPRYVSLKSDRVNLREGPSKDHRTAWLFQRAGLPVEITAEFDTWRKVRDSEGSEGWVLQALLSGRRTVIISPWKKGEIMPLYAKPQDNAETVANLQAGVIANIKRCDKGWCRIYGTGYDGYISQKMLWGVYPDEKVE